jgi:hypothetical protein
MFSIVCEKDITDVADNLFLQVLGNLRINQQKYNAFINATQNGTVRIDASSASPPPGLCTDTLTGCKAIILVGESGKISLTHTDSSSDIQSLAQEFGWIRKVIKFYLAVNIKTIDKDDLTGFITALKTDILNNSEFKHIEIEIIDAVNGAIAISKEGKILIPTYFELGLSPYYPLQIGKTSPYTRLRHHINILNHFCSNKDEILDLQYDCDKWTPMPILSQSSQTLIGRCKKRVKEDFVGKNLKIDLKTFIKNCVTSEVYNGEVLFHPTVKPRIFRRDPTITTYLMCIAEHVLSYIDFENSVDNEQLRMLTHLTHLFFKAEIRSSAKNIVDAYYNVYNNNDYVQEIQLILSRLSLKSKIIHDNKKCIYVIVEDITSEEVTEKLQIAYQSSSGLKI